jgi:hypothetical protein
LRKELKARIELRFAQEIARVLPGFQMARGRSLPRGPGVKANPGESIFASLETPPECSLFVSLVFHPQIDSFGVEVSWSKEGVYPTTLLPVASVSSFESVVQGRVPISAIAEWAGDAIIGTYDLWPISVDPKSAEFEDAFITAYLRPHSETEIERAMDAAMATCLLDVGRYVLPFVKRARSRQ